MKPWSLPPLALVTLLALSQGCASTDTTAQATLDTTASATTAPRRHHRRRTDTTANGTAGTAPSDGAPTAGSTVARTVPIHPVDTVVPLTTFGSPVVASGPAHALTPRWRMDDHRGRLLCDGDPGPQVYSPQSPLQPTNASIVRSFIPADRAVRGCAPPATVRGRLPIHGVFLGNGAPQEFVFPGVVPTESQALCLGRALCELRLPTFQQVNASVDYEFLVAVPTQGDTD